MNMRLPGFSAESALVKAKGVYRGITARAAPQGVTPAGNYDDAFCDGKEWGDYRHPYLCTHYIHCAPDGAWDRVCPDCTNDPPRCPDGRLHYDVDTNACLWPDETNCTV